MRPPNIQRSSKQRPGGRAQNQTSLLTAVCSSSHPGDEPMTPAHRAYLERCCRDTGETFDANLTKAEASTWIDELRRLSGEKW